VALRISAISRTHRQTVVVVDVAVGAGVHLAGGCELMRIGERESCCAVIERRIQERDGVVTVRAIRGSEQRTSCRVYRIGGSLPSATVVRVQVALRVTAVSGSNLQIIVVVDVAVGAGIHLASRSHLMRVGQWETRGAVIKIGGVPRNGVVAVRARGHGEDVGSGGMLRIGRLLPGGQVALRVAAVGSRDLQVEVAAYMTVRTGHIGMAIGEREIDRRGSVVDIGSEPTIEVVAGFASLGEACGYVIRDTAAKRLREIPIRLMAGDASG